MLDPAVDPSVSIDVRRHPNAPAPGVELPSHYRGCFGCGEDQPHGLHLRVIAGEGPTLRAECLVTRAHQGAPGLIHGGVLAAVFDEALGALNWLLMHPAVTASLHVDFRKPVRVGERISIEARIDGVAGRKVTCSGEGSIGDGTVVAAATGLFVQVPLEHFAKHGRADEVRQASGQDRPRPWLDLSP